MGTAWLLLQTHRTGALSQVLERNQNIRPENGECASLYPSVHPQPPHCPCTLGWSKASQRQRKEQADKGRNCSQQVTKPDGLTTPPWRGGGWLAQPPGTEEGGGLAPAHSSQAWLWRLKHVTKWQPDKAWKPTADRKFRFFPAQKPFE